MEYERLKAKYEGQVFKPERALNLPEGTEVTLLIIPPFRSFLGLLDEIKEDSVTVQHKARQWWG